MPTEERSFRFSNFARSVLSAGVSASATQLEVDEATVSRFPNIDPTYDEIFSCMLFHPSSDDVFEVVYATQVVGGVITVERGKEGSTARAFPAGSILVHTLTAGYPQQLNEIAAEGELTTPVLSGAVSSDFEIHLEWTAAVATPEGNFVTSYTVFRKVDSGEFAELATLDGNVLEYDDTAVDVELHDYDYFVVARAQLGADSENSNTVSIAAGATAFVLSYDGADEYGDVLLSWEASVPFPTGNTISGYDIFRGTVNEAGLLCDGTDSVRTFPGASTAFELRDSDYTFECWLVQTQRAVSCVPICIGGDFGTNAGMYLSISAAGRVSPRVATAASPISGEGPSSAVDIFPLNTRTHIAFVKEGLELRAYVNGVLVAIGTVSEEPLAWDVDHGHGVYIGNYYITDGTTGEGLVGSILEARFTKEALYDANFTPDEELTDSGVNMAALLHFNYEGSPTTFTDEKGSVWAQRGQAAIAFSTPVADQSMSNVDSVADDVLSYVDAQPTLERFTYKYHVEADAATGASAQSNTVTTE